MYIHIAVAVVLFLGLLLALGIWWERAAANAKRATHARRQTRRRARAWAYSWVFGRRRDKQLTYRPADRDERA